MDFGRLTSKGRMKKHSQNPRPSGFTIVELLIVVVVIAILAAITIVSYNGIVSQSKVSRAQSDLTAIRKKLELYKIDNSTFPTRYDDAAWKKLLSEAAGTNTNSNTFVLCRTETGDRAIVIAWVPLIGSNPTAGTTMWYIDSEKPTYTSIAYPGQGSAGTVAQAACAAISPSTTNSVWSFQL